MGYFSNTQCTPFILDAIPEYLARLSCIRLDKLTQKNLHRALYHVWFQNRMELHKDKIVIPPYWYISYFIMTTQLNRREWSDMYRLEVLFKPKHNDLVWCRNRDINCALSLHSPPFISLFPSLSIPSSFPLHPSLQWEWPPPRSAPSPALRNLLITALHYRMDPNTTPALFHLDSNLISY